jgi:hypothetical protein
MVATPEKVWLGGYRHLTRVDLGPTPAVTTFEFADSFEVTAADAAHVWGVQLSGDHEEPSFFRRVSNDGEVRATLPCQSLALAGAEAWCVTSSSVSLVDPVDGDTVAAGHPRADLGLDSVQDVDGAGWGGAYNGVLVRLTRR